MVYSLQVMMSLAKSLIFLLTPNLGRQTEILVSAQPLSNRTMPEIGASALRYFQGCKFFYRSIIVAFLRFGQNKLIRSLFRWQRIGYLANTNIGTK